MERPGHVLAGPAAPTRLLAAVRGWPLWSLNPLLRGYAVTVIILYGTAVATAAAFTPWRVHHAVVAGVLLAIGAVTVESTRRIGEPAAAGKDAHGVWELAIAIALPPFYAFVAPAVMLALTQLRVRRTLAHRRIFSAAAVGLSYGAASLVFHLSWQHASPRAWPVLWGLLAVGCGVLRWVINYVLILAAVHLDDPAARLTDLLGGASATLWNDVAELFIGLLLAWCAATSTLVLLFVLPWVILLERSTRQAQLSHASHTDSATGLRSGPAWQREAAIQVTRARIAGDLLAAAIISIDDFQPVAAGGHADAVLLSVAGVIVSGIRGNDLAGRLGAAEFTLLLSQADATHAPGIARRLQDGVSRIAPWPGKPDGAPGLSTSIGVAFLSEGMTDLTDLLAAADTALHQARKAGPGHIRLAGPPPC